MSARDLASSFAAHLDVDRHVAGEATAVPGGTLLRSSRFPSSWDLNQVVLEPGGGRAEVEAAMALAGRELRDAAHRRVTVPAPREQIAAPDGWTLDVLLVMLAPSARPPWPAEVQTVSGHDLRAPRLERRSEGAGEAAEELADMQVAFSEYPGARSVAVTSGDGEHVAWAQAANGAIDDVWVQPPHRGRGLGRAVTAAAVACGGWFLWTDEDDPRPQSLYRSLGFVAYGRLLQLTRHPRLSSV